MREETTRRGTYPYIDILRCTAIYLVIALHCTSSYLADPSLYGTAVWWVCNAAGGIARMGAPLFFMVSGFLLLTDERTLDIPAFYTRRLARLLVPFLVWDALYFLQNHLFYDTPLTLGLFFTELLTQRGSKYHLWFVYKIAAIYLLLPFIKRILDHCPRRGQWTLLAVVMLQPTIFPFIGKVLPWLQIDLFGTVVEGRVAYFLLGYLLGTGDFSPRARRGVYLAGAAGYLLNVFCAWRCSSSAAIDLVFDDGCSLTHFLTAAAFFLFVKERWAGNRGRSAPFFSALAPLTYGIYLSHPLILDSCIALVGGLYSPLGAARSIPLFFAVTALGSTLLVFLLSRCPLLRTLLVSGLSLSKRS